MPKDQENNNTVETIFLFLGGTVFMSQVRDYIKIFPAQKQKVIRALEQLIEEIKNS